MLGGSASVSTRGRVSLRGMAELARQTGSRARESVTLVSMPESPLPHVLLSARRIVEGWLLSASGQVGLVPIRVRAPSWIAAVTGVHPILAEVKLGVGTTRPDARVRGVTIKLRGKSLVLEPKFAVGSTTVALPILLSKASSLTEAVSFAAASTLAGWLVDRLRGRRARRNRFACAAARPLAPRSPPHHVLWGRLARSWGGGCAASSARPWCRRTTTSWRAWSAASRSSG